MFSDGVRSVRGAKMSEFRRLSPGWRCLHGMLWVLGWPPHPPNGAKTVSPADLSICLPLRAHRARTRRGLPHAPARGFFCSSRCPSMLVPRLFYRQPQSSGGDKGALTAVSRCSQRAQPQPPDTCGLCTPSGSHGWHGLELQCTRRLQSPRAGSLRSQPCSQLSATNQADASVNPALLDTHPGPLCADTRRPFADGSL